MAAKWIRNSRKVPVDKYESRNGFVWVSSKDMMYVSCFLTSNESISEFQEKLDFPEKVISEEDGEVLVAGDINGNGCHNRAVCYE